MSKPDKFYPVQGTNKYQTVSFPITKAFRVDFGAGTTGTHAMETFPKGSIILGFCVRIEEAMEAAGSATVQFGFTGKTMLTSAHGSGTCTLNSILVPLGLSSNTASAPEPYILTADDTFDLIVGTTSLTAGKADIFVTYIPIPGESLDTDDFRQWVTT